MTTIHLFPGQGSQSKGMGQGLLEGDPELVREADRVLGWSVRELCLENPDGRLGRTEFTQPAVYVIDVLAYRRRVAETGREPDFLAGHSLGEYAALHAAGAFDFATGLALVARRGELMGKVAGSGMSAVFGLAAGRLGEVLAAEGATEVDLANLNAPDQVVIAGRTADLERVTPALRAAGATRVVPLAVSAAFHSRFMAGVRREFESFLAGFELRPLLLPTMSNVTARPHRDADLAADLGRQIDHPVRWAETIEYLLREPEPVFEEIGPGRVLTGLTNRIRQAS